MIDFISIVIFAGSVFSWILAGGQLWQDRRTAGNYFFFVLFLCLGYWLFYAGLFKAELLAENPHFIMTHIPVTFLIGPLGYIYFNFLITGIWQARRAYLLHGIPALFSLVWLMPFFMGPVEYKLCIQHQAYRVLISTPCNATAPGMAPEYGRLYEQITLWLLPGPKISILIHLLLLIGPIWRARRANKEKSLPVTVALALAFFAMAGIALGGQLLGARPSIIVGTLLLFSVLCLIYFAGQRFPEFLHLRLRGMRSGRYHKSLIQGIDTDAILTALHTLMHAEKVYADEDLSLNTLASMVSLSPSQLSEILNSRLQKNFNQYVNEYRVEEAKRCLAEEPDKSVLFIAMSVGFNVKSTFNRAFKNYTGLTPAEYRKRFASANPR